MIGVFDSGVGGLSVLTWVRAKLPDADLVYVGDRARAPYGERSLAEVERMSHEIADWLLAKGARCLVVACNTASAAALDSLRARHPEIPIVGMEPAVKPAAAGTRNGKVAVFATKATFQGRLFASVVSRFASGIEVIERACPGWVELVERGIVSGAVAEGALRVEIEPVVAAGADVVVLGCTHFSFLAPLISELSGMDVIDPAPAVAAQVARVAADDGGQGDLLLAASGDRAEFARLAAVLAGIEAPVAAFEA